MKVQVEELAMLAELKEVMKFLMIIEHEFMPIVLVFVSCK
jgi:hypothetical protein